jgi:predicted SnoaL-like aldol condensation-catalyzing enzyme
LTSPPKPALPITAAASDADARLYYIFIEEVLQRGAMGVAEQFLAADFVDHGASGDRLRHDFISELTIRRARFPDAVWTIELLADVGGLVVCHTTMTAPGLAVPGWESVVIRCAAGKIAECWRISDHSLLAIS